MKKCCLRGYFEHQIGKDGQWVYGKKGFRFRCLSCRALVWADDHYDAAMKKPSKGARRAK